MRKKLTAVLLLILGITYFPILVFIRFMISFNPVAKDTRNPINTFLFFVTLIIFITIVKISMNGGL